MGYFFSYLFIAHCGFFSHKIEDRVSDLFAKASTHNMIVACEKLRKNGYPLRVGVVCDQFQFSWPLHRFSLSTARLTVGTPIYTPHFVEFNIHSPASIVFSQKTPVVSRWRNLVIQTEPYWRMDKTFKFMVEGLEIFTIASSLEDQKFQGKLRSQTKKQEMIQEDTEEQASLKDTSDVIVSLLNNVFSLDKENTSQKIAAEFLRLDLKQEKNNLSGHMTFDDFDASVFFAPYFVDFPKIDGNLKWTFNDVPHLFKNGVGPWKWRLYGKSGFLKHSELTFHSGGGMRVSGPFSFDDEGYLTAEFKLIVVQHIKFLTILQRLFPEQAKNLHALFFILGAMPKSAEGYPILPLLINHGRVKLGFLGRFAPL